MLLFLSLLICFSATAAFAGSFHREVDLNSWGGGQSRILDNGELIISLDQYSGSGFQSQNEYLFAKIDMQIRLVQGNSAGTVTSFYISSTNNHHDEVDFEFLGKLEGDPYILQTNIFLQGIGEKEMQFFLWFDPTADFHNYTILWTPLHIVLSVDGIPIREYKNRHEHAVPYAIDQPMRFYASLWNADSWATKGGAVKINWSKAPFNATYRNLGTDGCVWSNGKAKCSASSDSWMQSVLDSESLKQMKWAQDNYMFYDYCTDVKRFRQGLPIECNFANKTYAG